LGSASDRDTLIGELVFSGEFYDTTLAIQKAAYENPAQFGGYFDQEAICDAALADEKFTEKFRTGFKRGFMSASKKNAGYEKNISAAIQGGGSFRALKVHRHGEQHSALFRVVNNAGLNYLDLQLTKKPDGKILITDFYSFASGEDVSTTIQRTALLAAAADKRNFVQKMLKTGDNDVLKNNQAMLAMTQAFQAQDYPRVLELHTAMPPSLQESKLMLIMCLTASANTSRWEQHRQIVETYRRVYPNDRAIDLLTIGMLTNEKKVDEALAAINRIDALVGGDYYLDLYRGAAFREAGRIDEAEQMFLRAAQNPAALVDCYWHLVDLALKNKQHDKTLQYLQTIEQRYQLPFADLTSLPDYAEFVKSPQYQEWLDREQK
jgi:hypothetical protein